MKVLSTGLSLRSYICPTCTKSLHRQRRRALATVANKSPDIYDVVCVGGGPAGLSLLTALRASPITSTLKLALIESQDLAPSNTWNPPPTEFSNRASSLTPASSSFLSTIGVWSHINHSRTQSYYDMQVWDGITSSRISFSWDPPSSSSPTTKSIATMTENPNLTHALLARLSILPPISTFAPTTLTSINSGPPPLSPSSLNLSSYPHLTLSSHPSPIAARLLVGADGLNSPVRNFANIPSRGWDYDRHGVVATVKLSNSVSSHEERKIAYQRFLPTGPIALLPLPGPYATLVWSTLPQHATRLKILSEADLAATIDAGFRLSITDLDYLLTLDQGQEEEVHWREKHTSFPSETSLQVPAKVVEIQQGSVASFPLRMRHADSYISERIALIGDAAHTIHPLAGQGLNQGLGDVEALVHAIEETVIHGGDIGREGCLEAYERQRWAGNHRLLGVTDKLHKLYSVRRGPVVGLRSLGLEAVEAMGGVKKFLMRQASGL